jgi:hypothetical protein
MRQKTKYETKAKEARNNAREKAVNLGLDEKHARKMARELRPKCVNCKRPVGTIFKMREDRLLAYCGDSKDPCPLKIEIFKGRFESDDQFANYTAKSLLETKEQIICQKMDVLFNYSSEEETVTKFKDLIEEYNLFAFLHKTDLETREDKRFNVHKRELIKAKIKKIADIKTAMNAHTEEYESSGNRDELNAAMNIYIREYMPEINNLRMMKYSVMEMIVTSADTDKETPIMVLNQSAASLRQLETLHGEVPKVLKFVTGAMDKNVPAPEEFNEEEPNKLEDNGEEGVVPFEQEEPRYGEE